MGFKSALNEVVKQLGKDKLLDKNLVSILSDYSAFKETPSYKIVLRLLFSDGSYPKFVLTDNDNERERIIDRFIKMTALNVITVRKVLKLLDECYNGMKKALDSRNLSEVKNCSLPNTENECAQNPLQCNPSNFKIKPIKFMGLSIGMDLNEYDKMLHSKGFQRGKSTYESTRYFGEFLSFKRCVIYVYWTPKSKTVYRIVVEPRDGIDNSSMKLHYRSIRDLYISKYINPISEDTSRKPRIKFKDGDVTVELKLFGLNKAPMEIIYENENILNLLKQEQSEIQKGIRAKRQQDLMQKIQSISNQEKNHLMTFEYGKV